MDSDPLVPTEISPTKKYLMFGSVGLVAIFLIATMIAMVIKAKQYHHAGLYVSAIALLVLSVVIVFLNLSLPQDYMENRAKYAMMALNLCLIFVAIGFLLHAFEKTPHPPCPECPPVNTCFLGGIPEGIWGNKADCFPPEKAEMWLTVSATKTCPPPGTFNNNDPSIDTMIMAAEQQLSSSEGIVSP